jgi:hypothetical protein
MPIAEMLIWIGCRSCAGFVEEACMSAIPRLAALLLCLLPGLGCVSPNHRATELALSPEEGGEGMPLATRNRVHVYIINGNEPFSTSGIDKLRKKLNESGFAKVSAGGLFYGRYFENAIRKQHHEDPEARFILVGYGFGVASADSIAARLQGEGVPIDSVIAMAPRSFPGWNTTPDPNLNRIVIDVKASTSAFERAYAIGDAKSISGDAAAAEVVRNAVVESCHSLPPEVETQVALLPIIDNPAPLPMAKPAMVKTAPPAKKPVPGILTGTQIR